MEYVEIGFGWHELTFAPVPEPKQGFQRLKDAVETPSRT